LASWRWAVSGELIYSEGRCTAEYHGTVLRITVLAFKHPASLYLKSLMLVASLVPFILLLFFKSWGSDEWMMCEVLLAAIACLLLSVAWEASGWEVIEVDDQAITIRQGVGPPGRWSLLRRTYYFEGVRELRIAPQTHYWSDPEYKSLRYLFYRNNSSSRAWYRGALVFKYGWRRVHFGSRLQVDIARDLLALVWDHYRCYWPEPSIEYPIHRDRLEGEDPHSL
jgi:hypothetical protein